MTNDLHERSDAVVVVAGPAGSTAAGFFHKPLNMSIFIRKVEDATGVTANKG